MNCPKCNAPVAGDSAFCSECGAKIELPVQAPVAPAAPAAYCPECGAPMAADAVFCENCGNKAGAPAPAPAPAPAAYAEEPEAPAKKPAAKWLKLGIAAVALIAIVVIIISLFGGSNPNFALYRKDGALMYSKLSGKPFEITDESTSDYWLTKDGSKLFYLEDGKLYYRDVTKAKAEAKQLVKGVSYYRINEDGSKVFYEKDGDLRWCDLKDNSGKIASNVSDWGITKDGKTVIYTTYNEEKVTLNRATISGKKVTSTKITSGYDIEIEYMSDNGKTVIYTVEKEDSTDLYTQTGKKDPVKIESDINSVYACYENGSFYYTVMEEDEDEDGYITREKNLFFFDGKKSTKVASDIDSLVDYAADAAVVVYSIVEEKDDEYETTYYVAVKAKSSELKLDDVSSITLKADGKELLAIADYDAEDGYGTIYKASIGSAVKAPKKVDGVDEPVAAIYTPNGKKTIYLGEEDNNTFTLYVDGKKITDDVSGLDYDEESGMIIYMTDYSGGEFTLWQLKGSKGKKINDDVSDYLFAPGGTLLYLCDGDDGEYDLFRTTGGKGKQVDDEVTSLIHVTYAGTYYGN